MIKLIYFRLPCSEMRFCLDKRVQGMVSYVAERRIMIATKVHRACPNDYNFLSKSFRLYRYLQQILLKETIQTIQLMNTHLKFMNDVS